MRDNLYKRLPPLERKPDGSLYHMTPAQRKQANALIRRECCHCDDGNCMVLDDGDACTCPQTISYTVCCKWFLWAVLPLDKALEAEIYRGTDLKRCAVCGAAFIPCSNRAKYCPDCATGVHRRRNAGSWNSSFVRCSASTPTSGRARIRFSEAIVNCGAAGAIMRVSAAPSLARRNSGMPYPSGRALLHLLLNFGLAL